MFVFAPLLTQVLYVMQRVGTNAVVTSLVAVTVMVKGLISHEMVTAKGII